MLSWHRLLWQVHPWFLSAHCSQTLGSQSIWTCSTMPAALTSPSAMCQELGIMKGTSDALEKPGKKKDMRINKTNERWWMLLGGCLKEQRAATGEEATFPLGEKSDTWAWKVSGQASSQGAFQAEEAQQETFCTQGYRKTKNGWRNSGQCQVQRRRDAQTVKSSDSVRQSVDFIYSWWGTTRGF